MNENCREREGNSSSTQFSQRAPRKILRLLCSLASSSPFALGQILCNPIGASSTKAIQILYFIIPLTKLKII